MSAAASSASVVDDGFDVAIIGGGLAGALTGIALKKVASRHLPAPGLRVAIFESYSAASNGCLSNGAWLTIGCNGVRLLTQLGLADAVRAASHESAGIELFNEDFVLLGDIPMNTELLLPPVGTVGAEGVPRPPRARSIRRSTLLDLLTREAAALGVVFVYGQALAAVSTGTARHSLVTFVDGTVVSADLVVGADGVHSTVRRIIDPTAAPPVFAHLTNLGGTIDLSLPESADLANSAQYRSSQYRMVFGRKTFFAYTVDKQLNILYWIANSHSSDPSVTASIPKTERKAHLAECFKDDLIPPVQELLRGFPASHEAELIWTNQWSLPTVRRWTGLPTVPLVLVGDAAHAASLSSGQGVSMAAEDAAVLAMCIRDVVLKPGPAATESGASSRLLQDAVLVQAALDKYVAVRQSRAEAVVRYGDQNSSGKAEASWFSRKVRNGFMRFGLWMGKRHIVRASTWLFDYHLCLEEGAAGLRADDGAGDYKRSFIATTTAASAQQPTVKGSSTTDFSSRPDMPAPS